MVWAGFLLVHSGNGKCYPQDLKKWVTLPLMPTNKMGSLQRQQNCFLIIMKHTTCITMKRCDQLYTNIPYSKYCLHWIQISCHSQSQSHSHISGSAYFSSVLGALSTASTQHTHDSSHYHCWSMMRSMQPLSNWQFLMRNATHWPMINMRTFVTHRRP